MNTDPNESPKQIDFTERLERLTAQQQARSERLTEGLRALTATATSADRTIRVMVGPGGTVQEISLTQQALRHGPERLGQLILETIKQAAATVFQEMNDLVQESSENSVDYSALMRGETPRIPVADPDEYLRSRGITW